MKGLKGKSNENKALNHDVPMEPSSPSTTAFALSRNTRRCVTSLVSATKGFIRVSACEAINFPNQMILIIIKI